MSAGPPTVSVIIPTRDRPELLAAAVGSAQAQTHPPLEVIVVDDASEPPAVTVDGARLLRLDVAVGPGAARNRAAEEARGEWLAFLDDDDRWRPDKLERQLLAADDGVDAVFCGWELRDDDAVLGVVAAEGGDSLEDRLLRDPTVVPSTLLVRATAFRALGGFDPALHYGEDWDFSLRLAERHRVVAVPAVLVERQIHPHRRFGERLVTDHRELMRRIGPRLAALDARTRARIRARHLLRLARYRLRVLLEPGVVGRLPWRARHALRRRRSARS